MSEIRDRVLAHLDHLGVAHEVIPVDPDLADTAAFCAHYGYDPEESANCILVRTKAGDLRFAVCLVQATRRLDVNRTVRRLLDTRKASFASPDETSDVTGMTPGGVTPFGLPDGLPVYVDAPILALDRVVVGGGDRTVKVLLEPGELRRVPGLEVVEGLGRPA